MPSCFIDRKCQRNGCTYTSIGCQANALFPCGLGMRLTPLEVFTSLELGSSLLRFYLAALEKNRQSCEINLGEGRSTLYPFLPAGARAARMAGPNIALRFPCLSVCLFVCLFVCASALITCAVYYVIRYYATAVYSSFWRFAGQATANEGSCVLPRWRKLGRQP